MDDRSRAEVADVPVLRRRALVRAVRRQVIQLAATLLAISVVAFLLGVVASGVQARRNEARSADLLIVVAPGAPSTALIEHSFALHRRGYAPEMLVVGAGSSALEAALVERGVAGEAVQAVVGGESETAQLRAALSTAQATGVGSVLIAGDAAGLLRWLKVSSDAGLQSSGSPTPGSTPGLLELVEAGARYWTYILLQT